MPYSLSPVTDLLCNTLCPKFLAKSLLHGLDQHDISDLVKIMDSSPASCAHLYTFMCISVCEFRHISSHSQKVSIYLYLITENWVLHELHVLRVIHYKIQTSLWSAYFVRFLGFKKIAFSFLHHCMYAIIILPCHFPEERASFAFFPILLLHLRSYDCCVFTDPRCSALG